MSRRDCMNIKVEAELVRKAKVVAAARRVTLSDYVNELLRPLIDRDLAGVASGLLASTGNDEAPNECPLN